MKKYISFFKIRFQVGLQYRSASIAALTTQFLWGIMECAAYRAIYMSSGMEPPMEFSALVSYIWLKEAFLAMFNTWIATDGDIFTVIMNGDVAYELCRPVSLYRMWFAKSVEGRCVTAALKCIPIIAVSVLLPRPYRLSPPRDLVAFCFFLLTLFLGLFVTVAFCMVVYAITLFTISPQGLRAVLTGAVEFLSGSVIPFPFIPQPVRGILELLPFGSMQNVALRVYSGSLAGGEMLRAVSLQVFWIGALVLLGKAICRSAERRIVVQGG